MEIVLHCRDTQQKRDMKLGNGGGDLEKHLFEARTPQNSFM